MLKPGGYLVAFAFPTTYHLITKMVMDAGFVVSEMLIWQHEMGWPKSQDLGRKVEACRTPDRAEENAPGSQVCCTWFTFTYNRYID